MNSSLSLARSTVPLWLTARRRMGLAMLLGVGLLTLTGCGPRRLRVDYKNFEMAYAETSNHEVLLNLARLQNRDPTYFFKLGQITSQYRMNATLAGNGSYINSGTSAPGFGNVTGGGNPALLYENDPSFTFIPVNDETNAQLLLQPVPAETFYDLFQQGWRIDQLFRLMVERVEYTVPNAANTGCHVETLRNVPPPVFPEGMDRSGDRQYQRQLSEYVTFLRVSALMYALQKHGHLLLRGTSVFVPFDPNSYLVSGTVADKDAGGGHSTSAGPALGDILSASQKDASWELKDGRWLLGKTNVSAEFYLNPLISPAGADKGGKYASDTAAIQTEIESDADFKELVTGPALKTTLASLANGFSIEGVPGAQAGDPCHASPHLYLRSLLGLMAAAAQEEAPFESLLKNHPIIPLSAGETRRPDMRFEDLVPAMEQIPTIRIRKASNQSTEPPLVELNYNKTEYLIADASSPNLPENQYWNRDMFRLIGQLTSQVTVDISKFPLPTTLQLHQ